VGGATPTTTAVRPNSGGGSSGGAPGQATSSPAPGTQAGSCAGFKDGPGIDAHDINIGTIADLSGAEPNVFKDAADAMNAYVAYFNSTSSICGRQLKLHLYDSGLTAAGDHSASQAACGNFALVGSMTSFDSGGAAVTSGCGQPDIRNTATTETRFESPTTFPVYSLNPAHPFLAPWAWAKSQNPGMVKHAAFVYLNAGASETDAQNFIKGTEQKLGYDWQKTIVVDLTSVPNWNAYANELKSAGIQFVSSILNLDTPKLAEAFEQADYHPFYLADNSAYSQAMIGTGSQAAAMEGTYVYTQSALLSEESRNPEMQTYEEWLTRTGGGAPDAEGMFSWSAGELFTQLATELGGKLTRQSLIDAIRKVHTYTGNGLMTPMDPGQKITGRCASLLRVVHGHWVRASPSPYTCGPIG
jgi:ABC-type branched-subunit amino acid transport system substrate-binding protein